MADNGIDPVPNYEVAVSIYPESESFDLNPEGLTVIAYTS